MNPFPVDVWSVKEYGVEPWQQQFFLPVTTQEFKNLTNNVKQIYLDIINDSPNEVADALWVLYSWGALGIPSLLYAQLVVQRLEREGLSLSSHPSSAYYQALIEGQAIKNLIGKPLPQVASWKRKTRSQLRASLENIKYHGLDISYYLNISSKSPYLATNYSRRWLEKFSSFATSDNRDITIIHPAQLMPAKVRHTNSLPAAKQAVQRLIGELDQLAKKYEINFKKSPWQDISAIFIDAINYSSDYIEQTVQELSKLKGTTILASALGNTFKRSLCMAAQRTGFKMVGFSHGDSFGIFKTDGFSYIEMSMVDTFVVPSQGAVELFSLAAQKFLHPYGKNPEIVANVSNSYAKVRESNQLTNVSSSIKSVMVLEFPLLANYGPLWAYRLDLTLRIGKLLREHGVKSILKRHPDRLRESAGVYDVYYDETVVTSFEKVYDEADAYIFLGLATTTFGFALLTNKPIIIFENFSLEEVWDSAGELLRKRCRVVPSWFADDGRFMFDEKKFIEALREPPHQPNDEFIERYMLS